MLLTFSNRLWVVFILTVSLIVTLVGANLKKSDQDASDLVTGDRLDELLSKIRLLESQIDKMVHAAESPIEGIKKQEMITGEKSANLDSLQSFLVAAWNEHGRPAIDVMIEKAFEGTAQVQKWAEAYIDALRTKWLPAVREDWYAFMDVVEPNLQILTAMTIEVYRASKVKVRPHVAYMRKMVDPFYQEATKLLTMASRPNTRFGKARTFLKHYTKREIRCFWKFTEIGKEYHNQIYS